MPRVHVVATGGTIASTADPDGAAPSVSVDALLDAVPDLASIADVSAEQVSQRPGFDMGPDVLERVARAVRDCNADGVVVTHGTDTMAESAYALDLTLGPDAPPVVLTGAQRRPDERSPDGPANLRTAVRAAAHDRVGVGTGAALAFNDRLHAARDVVKTHTTGLETFQSPNRGPLALFTRDGVDWYREPGSAAEREPAPAALHDEGVLDDAATVSVPIVTTGSGVDGTQVSQAVERDADGLVVAGTGLGNVTGALGDAIADAVDHLPVVVASRCHAGPTEPVYGTDGGAVTLESHGVSFAGDLPPWKARIALLLALAADVEPTAVLPDR